MSIKYNSSPINNGLVLHLDANNPKCWSQNVHPYPIDLNSWITSGIGMTVSRDTTNPSPVGKNTLKLVTSTTSSYTSTYSNSIWNLAPAVSGETWTASFWVKGDSNFSASAILFEARSNGTYISDSLHHPYFNVTTEWQRVELSATFTSAECAYIQFRWDNYNSGTTMWVDGLQIEKSSSATPFNKMTNINGSVVKDLSGEGNNGSFSGGTSYSQLDYGRFEFDGINSTIQCGIGSDYLPSLNIALEIWFRSDGITETTGTLPCLCGGTYGIRFRVFENTFSIGYDQSDLAAVRFLSSPDTYDFYNGEWYQVVGQTTPNEISLYINGEYAASNTISWTGVTRWLTNGFGFGRDNNNSMYYFTGSMSVIRVYNRVLTANEIKYNFNSMRGRFGL